VRATVREKLPLEAIEELYRDRYADFVRVATAISGSRETGRDAVHDAFVSAIRRRRDFRGEGSVDAWVWRIVVRNSVKQRSRGRRRLADPALTDDLPVEPLSGRDAVVRAAVAALPERQRLMLFLRYYGDLDYRTIARATGVKLGTVGAELHGAHRNLRRSLEEVLKT
jgi:RNA polymerase sigma-70 factor (ECF subfamily)